MTLPRSAVDSASLLRFIGGDSPADEHLMVMHWMQSHPGNRAEVDRLREAWELTRSAPEDWPTDALWSRIESRIRGQREAMAGRADASRTKPLVLMPPT